MSIDNENTTPTFIQTIQAIIDSKLMDVHTSMPAEVVSYDASKCMAIVRPVLKRKYKSQSEAIDLPLITNVPVMFQRANGARLRLPIKKGDTGMLSFSERSIDKWLTSGGQVDPLDPRAHSLSDAVFYMGLYPSNKKMQALGDADSLVLEFNDSYLEIGKDNKFKLSNGTDELFDLFSKTLEKTISLCNQLGNVHKTNTALGPQQPINFDAYKTLKIDYESLKSKLDNMKKG